MQIPFIKLHGLGNDFVLIDWRKSSERSLRFIQKEAPKIANRKTGVGFDQLLVLSPSKNSIADAKLHILNADGSRAEMCGNGLRAAAVYLWKQAAEVSSTKIKPSLFFQTDVGILEARLGSSPKELTRNTAVRCSCEMGVVRAHLSSSGLKKAFSFLAQSGVVSATVNVGNPHLVVFFQTPVLQKKFFSTKVLAELGPKLETYKKEFPERTNIEFAVYKKDDIEALVWERGVGLTEACGTGAVAVAEAARFLELTKQSEITVRFPGGNSKVIFKDKVFLQATAQEVFSGVWITDQT